MINSIARMNNCPKIPQKNTFTFDYYGNGASSKIIFDSDFDSGNCSLVQQISPSKVLFALYLIILLV